MNHCELVWIDMNDCEMLGIHSWTMVNGCEFNEQLWIGVNSYERLWTGCEFIWMIINRYEFIWTIMNSYENIWTTMYSYEFICTIMNRWVWIHMNNCEQGMNSYDDCDCEHWTDLMLINENVVRLIRTDLLHPIKVHEYHKKWSSPQNTLI